MEESGIKKLLTFAKARKCQKIICCTTSSYRWKILL